MPPHSGCSWPNRWRPSSGVLTAPSRIQAASSKNSPRWAPTPPRSALTRITPLWGMQLTGVELELHFGGAPGSVCGWTFQARRVTGTAAQWWLVPGLPGGNDVAVANRVVPGREFQHAVEHHAAAV